MSEMFRSLSHLLRHQAQERPDDYAFTFLVDGKDQAKDLTFGELHDRACAIASVLVQKGLGGKKLVLLYPQGLDLIEAFFGCLYAGATAVPAYPPGQARLEKTLPRLVAIAEDCGAAGVMCTSQFVEGTVPHILERGALKGLVWIASDAVATHDGKGFVVPDIAGTALAFLQYTSGSTGTPKGVMLSHSNLLDNQAIIARGFGRTIGVGVSWLPLYHDMGLIGHVIQPVYAGIRSVLMSPMDFLRSPFYWLRAITKFGATTSGAPNFAWDLCTRKVSADQRQQLDLSSWHTAYVGAEPIRADTLRRFAETFESCGFRRDAFLPCYGLAEATLMVTGGTHHEGYATRDCHASSLGTGLHVRQPDDAKDFKRIVACGKPMPGTDVRIVNPEALVDLGTECVGEIWVSNASVGVGYWGKPDLSGDTFRAKMPGNSATYLRTGDLGFLDAMGDLYVTGRLKDVIILKGRNFYPHDLEHTAETAHACVRPNSSAAFTVDVRGEPRLVLVAEFDRRHKVGADPKGPGTERRSTDLEPGEINSAVSAAPPAESNEPSDVISKIRQALLETNDVQLYTVALLRPGQVPKTSSGKIRRAEARAMWEAGAFDVTSSWTIPETALTSILPPARGISSIPSVRAVAISANEIEAMMQTWLTETLGQPVDPERQFSEYGVDSNSAVRFARHIEITLEHRIPPTLLWDYPSVRELATYLAEESGKRAGKDLAAPAIPKAPPAPKVAEGADAGSIERVMLDWLEQSLQLRPDPTKEFSSYGVDSASAVRFSRYLEDTLGRKVPPTVFWDYPTVRSLSEYLAEVLAVSSSSPGSAVAPQGEGGAASLTDDDFLALLDPGKGKKQK